MIQFVNAKLNLGLNITGRRADGYHLLETIFYPVGLHNGTPVNPQPFGDILEAVPLGPECSSNSYRWMGRHIDCPQEKNLVYRAAELISRHTGRFFDISLVKCIPDGAGLGGGSADATFTLRLLNRLSGDTLSVSELKSLALGLGADCPFFVENAPAFGEGIGENLTPVEPRLKGYWAVIVKPDVYISTREAFAGIHPSSPVIPLMEIYNRPVTSWSDSMVNDFEAGIFTLHPELGEIKRRIYAEGAIYAQMSGSGSALFGIFEDEMSAQKSQEAFADLPTYICLL